MCGLAGAVGFTYPLNAGRLKPMVDAIGHRGPDDSGFLVWQSGKWSPRQTSYGVPFNETRFRQVSPLLPSIDTPAGAEDGPPLKLSLRSGGVSTLRDLASASSSGPR